MQYKINWVGNSTEVDGKYGTQIRSAFKVEGDERQLSAFTKYPLVVGQEIDGSIVTVEKEGREFHNFKFTPKTFETKASPSFQPTPDLLRVERKLDTITTTLGQMTPILNDIKGVLGSLLQKDQPF